MPRFVSITRGVRDGRLLPPSERYHEIIRNEQLSADPTNTRQVPVGETYRDEDEARARAQELNALYEAVDTCNACGLHVVVWVVDGLYAGIVGALADAVWLRKVVDATELVVGRRQLQWIPAHAVDGRK